MKSLDQFDPLPKLGAKVQTEVVYYHQEEKEIKPHLYEKDGKLSYRPPEPQQTQADVVMAALDYLDDYLVEQKRGWCAPLFTSGAVEEEKQDNKLDVSHGHAYFTDSAGNDIARPIDAEGWISHTPGDPMPCDPETLVKVKFGGSDTFEEGLSTRANYWARGSDGPEDCWTGENTESQIIAWKPAA